MTPEEWERFSLKFEPEPMSGCWLWTASIRDSCLGYGCASYRGRTCSAHRLSYEHWRGAIPAGLHLDHLCRVRCCVNPWHLRVVTNRENLFAPGSLCLTKLNSEKAWCANGHAFDESNTHVGTRRSCRACKREYSQRWRDKQLRGSREESRGL